MFYRMAQFVLRLYFCIFYRLKVTGQENCPKEGAVILCANHVHFMDPMFIGSVTKRKTRFLAKKEIYSNWFFRLVLINGLTTIPVDRGTSDMKAFKTAVAYLKDGGAVGIFAQGTRRKELDVKDAKAGVALFALKGNAPVLPVCITSTYKLFSPVYINYGKPLDLNEYRDKKIKSELLEEMTELIMTKVAELGREL